MGLPIEPDLLMQTKKIIGYKNLLKYARNEKIAKN